MTSFDLFGIFILSLFATIAFTPAYRTLVLSKAKNTSAITPTQPIINNYTDFNTDDVAQSSQKLIATLANVSTPAISEVAPQPNLNIRNQSTVTNEPIIASDPITCINTPYTVNDYVSTITTLPTNENTDMTDTKTNIADRNDWLATTNTDTPVQSCATNDPYTDNQPQADSGAKDNKESSIQPIRILGVPNIPMNEVIKATNRVL